MPGQLCNVSGGIRNTNQGSGGILVPIGGKGSCGCGVKTYCGNCATCCNASGGSLGISVTIAGNFPFMFYPLDGGDPIPFGNFGVSSAVTLFSYDYTCEWSTSIYIGYSYYDPTNSAGSNFHYINETYVPLSDPSLQPRYGPNGNGTSAISQGLIFVFDVTTTPLQVFAQLGATLSRPFSPNPTGSGLNWIQRWPATGTTPVPLSSYCSPLSLGSPFTWTPSF